MNHHLVNERVNPSDDIETREMDRISELPDFIVHRILSFLTFWDDYGPGPAKLVRMSVLSKTWFNLTASYPVLKFFIHEFKCRKSFFKYIDYTTSRFCNQNTTARMLSITTTLSKPAEVDVVNRCLELVLKKGVRNLEIHIDDFYKSPPTPRYRLPHVISSVSVLKSWTLHNCELPSSLMFDVVLFKSLTHLRLENVKMDDEVITYLPTSCPILQVLNITSCTNLKKVCVYGHQNLKCVNLRWNNQIERIEIEAPNLSNLLIENTDGRGAPRMNVASCKKLTTVYYYGYPLPNDFLSNFPFIENLHLVTKCNNLKWSSHSLRTLVLDSDCDLEYIELDTPNLVSFIYDFHQVQTCPMQMHKRWPLSRDSTYLKGCMHFYPDRYIDIVQFQKLRRFMDKENGLKVLNLYIDASYSLNYRKLEKLNVIELPPYGLEHVELEVEYCRSSSAHYIFLVDAVLRVCRPQSLTLRSSSHFIDYDLQSDFVKLTCEKLLQQEDQGLTKIQIVSPSSSEAQKRLMDLKSSSMGLYRAGDSISFIKEAVKLSKKKQT